MIPKSVKWLTTLDLETFINKFANTDTKRAFLGVFPIDHLPKQLPHVPAFFILNTNSSNLPGQHWKAVFIDKNKNGEVFDSLATPISLKLQRWMNHFTKKWIMSKLILQNPFSPSCGAYVLYFIMMRLKYKSLTSCIGQFTNNVIVNDEIVEKFFLLVSQ